MKRRDFIQRGVGAGVLALGTAGTSTARAAGKKIRWRMALAVPKTLPIWGVGMQRFADKVKELTQNRLNIKVYGAGELVPALGTFDAVQAGEIQMGHSASYYWQGKLPASPFFTNVPFGMRSSGTLAWINAGGGQELWDEMMKPFGVRCFACGTTGHQTTGWFKKEIKTVADIKGLKVRVPGLAGKVYAAAGAIPVLLPGGELYTSLATGVIDAVEWVGPYHDQVLGLHRAAPYFYGTSWHEPGAILELMINEKAWQSIPADMQLALKLAASETTAWMWAQFEAKNIEYYQRFKSEGKVKLRQLPAPVLEELRKHSKTVLGKIATTNPISKKIFQSYTSFQKDYDDFYSWVEKGSYCG